MNQSAMRRSRKLNDLSKDNAFERYLGQTIMEGVSAPYSVTIKANDIHSKQTDDTRSMRPYNGLDGTIETKDEIDQIA